jgi:hypothetical protein
VTFGLVLAVALALSLTWRAVTLIGQGADPTVLSQAEVDAALATERAAATTGPAPTPTSDPTPTATPEPTSPTPETTTPPASAAVVRAWTVTGGQVGVSCEGASITLLYATPSDGWSVDVKRTGPQEVEAEFELGDDDTTVRAVCVAGVPEQQADDGGGGESGEGSSDD